MLELVSTSRTTSSGASPAEKNLMLCGLPFSNTTKSSGPSPVTWRSAASVTVTPSVTSSVAARNTP